MNSKNKEVEDRRVYIENILEKYGNGKNPVDEGSIKGTLDDQPFESEADSWVEHADKNGERLLLLFKSNDFSINLEVKQSVLSLDTYQFSMGYGDFLNLLSGNDQSRWYADTAKFSGLFFDASTGKLQCDVDATLWRNYPPNQETAKLKAKLLVVKPVK
ncbi:hypothetical protein [Pseudomonas moraviensis]|uniref:Uncharacterized protein n=1 Tax=Pseudomonas moraviensis TaxID=321662 RepID=A0A7Y9VVV1_9PSED|nr:hypothetical protein [Pseudomonas moraviensis]NYH09046.1 hypothetical protein [Pseudomonas moraviensis]